MLGECLVDPVGVDGSAAGLGLLPLRTTFAVDKRLSQTAATFADLCEPWKALAGVGFEGYEIHHGLTQVTGEPQAATVVLRSADGQAIGWQRGHILGVYAHGLFESGEVLKALFGVDVPPLGKVFNGLADFVDRHFDAGVLQSLLRRR
jgi:adenosylcobyric acid synthase